MRVRASYIFEERKLTKVNAAVLGLTQLLITFGKGAFEEPDAREEAGDAMA